MEERWKDGKAARRGWRKDGKAGPQRP
jgi:hypothetical protein